MENEIKTNVIIDWKMEDYNRNKQDFVAPQELTITITLSEYRNLVKEVSTKHYDIDKANNDKWQREKEIENLKKENAELKMKIWNLVDKETTDDCCKECAE